MIKEIWGLSEDECMEVVNLIYSMRFRPDGWVQCGAHKFILVMMIREFSESALTNDYSDYIIHPIFNNDRKSVIYDFREFKDICGWATVKTLKKYLFSLADSGFIDIEIISGNTHLFEVKINLNKILGAPKFERLINEI